MENSETSSSTPDFYAKILLSLSDTVPPTHTNPEQNEPTSPEQPGTSSNKQRKGKKRNPDNWRRNVIKRKRNAGESYISHSGKLVESHSFKDNVCHCPMKCTTKCTLQDRQKMHSTYWNLSLPNKLKFINDHVSQINKKRTYTNSTETPCKRQFTRLYSFDTVDSRIKVCKKIFCGILQLPSGNLDRALRRGSEGTYEETRGRHKTGKVLKGKASNL